jgi:DNA-binding transcriptional LysR family regulator
METRYLQAFISVCEHMSFTKAARELCLTQSAISQQIQNLESELGFGLFDRDGHSIKLTSGGRRFRDDIAPLIALYDCAVLNAQTTNKRSDEVFTLGCGASYAESWLPTAVRTFNTKHKAVDISIVQDKMSRLPYLARQGLIDAVVMLEPEVQESPGFEFIPIARSGCLAFIYPNNPLSRKKNVSVDDLSNERIVFIASAKESRRLHFLFRALIKCGIPLNDQIVVDCGEAALLLAASGLGVFPGLEMEEKYGRRLGLEVLPISDIGNPQTRIGIAYRDKTRFALATAFVDAARQAVKKLSPQMACV